MFLAICIALHVCTWVHLLQVRPDSKIVLLPCRTKLHELNSTLAQCLKPLVSLL